MASKMNNPQERVFRVGSRKSELALVQTKYVIGRLQKLLPKKKFEIHTMSTIGDRVLNVSLPKIGEKSLFTRDLEDALRNGGVDFVVHSLKDLPTSLPTGMAIGAVLEREDARDALVLRKELTGHTIATLPKGSVIGTSSLRRTAQIRRQYPHLIVCDIRGNLNTRLAKLDAPDSKFAGIVLAQAGLVRMGWLARINQVLEPTDLLYAVGQGALAIECRANDNEILDMLQNLICVSTSCRILAERSFLKTLGGGCSAPVAVYSKLNGNLFAGNKNDAAELILTGAVWSLDGSTELRAKLFSSLPTTKQQKQQTETDNGLNDSNNSNDSDEQPPTKRKKTSSSSSDEGSTTQRQSPTVINDSAEIEQLTATYDVNELIEKHINLAKKCPIVGATHLSPTLERGAGDADILSSTHCPLALDVGQDFMGQCPIVNNDAKVALASIGKCPLTKEATTTAATTEDQVDFRPTSSKCPFSALHATTKLDLTNTTTSSKNNNNNTTNTHGKCPFLQKTVQMFDYADEEQPLASKVPLIIEDVDNLFCGLFQHKFISRELYIKSNNLGEQLAQQLISNGALEIMKCAQAEIHAKV